MKRPSTEFIVALGVTSLVTMMIAVLTSTSAPAANRGGRAQTSDLNVGSFPLSVLVGNADVIVHGTVAQAADTTELVRGKPKDYHVAQIVPIEVFRGDVTGRYVEARDLGHRGGSRTSTYSDEVTFAEGEEVIVFLTLLGLEPNQYLSPLGLQDGKLTLIDHSQYGRIALTEAQRLVWEQEHVLPGAPLQTDALITEIRRLVR